MKTRFHTSLLRFLLLIGLSTFASAALHAGEDGTTTSVKLSAPDKPATLKVDIIWAKIDLIGTDGDTVTVTSVTGDNDGKQTREGGLRRLDDEVSFDLVEHDNVVSLKIIGGNTPVLRIAAPRSIALDFKAQAAELRVQNITGDIEIHSTNGKVLLEDISGAVVVNGGLSEVRAVYSAAPAKLIAITSMDGEVDLRVPADTKANVRLHTNNASILTDFDKKSLKTKKETGSSIDDQPEAASGTGLFIIVHQNGDYSLGANPTPVSLNDITKATADAIALDKDTSAIIRSDEKADMKRMTDAMDACQKAGLRKIRVQAGESSRPRPPLTGGKLVSGKLNGGGVDISINTMNGKIMLRQTKSGPAGSAINTGTKDNVTVNFQDPDNFTDVAEDFPSSASEYYLDELRDCVQKEAALRLPAGSKLTVTFTDIDLAGMIRPDRNNLRFMTSTTIPRAQLKFQLIGADGQVLQEGERKLSDMNYQMSIGIMGRNEPLYYDKELLKDWIAKEFKRRS